MPHVIPVADLNDPRLADYANLKDAALRAPGRFIAEGELVVRRLIDSGLGVASVLITPTRERTMAEALARLPDSTPVYLATQELMNSVVGFNIHRGVLAAGNRPAAPNVAELLARASVAVVLEDLANHDNVGGIFRAAAALAGPAHVAILYSRRTCDPLYRKAIRVSLGAAFEVPSAALDPWPQGLEAIRRAGFTLVALTPDPDATPIDRLRPPPRPALLLGAEGPGLSKTALAASEMRVRIPISPRIDSLNVAVAAAIALHRLAGPTVE